VRVRLSLIGLALLAFAADCASASAQQSGRIHKIGYLHLGSPNHVMTPMAEWRGGGAAFRDKLKDNGYVVGKNLVVEERHAYGDHDRLTAEAAALVASGVDVIVTFGTPTTVAAMHTRPSASRSYSASSPIPWKKEWSRA